MIGMPVGKYRLILSAVDITRRPDCDPTTSEGPRPLDLLKLDLRIWVFFGFWFPKQIKKHIKLGPGLALGPALALGCPGGP